MFGARYRVWANNGKHSIIFPTPLVPEKVHSLYALQVLLNFVFDRQPKQIWHFNPLMYQIRQHICIADA